ncbi:MAG: periplasmic heavy metal sensor [Betaproteobacteria bacterium]
MNTRSPRFAAMIAATLLALSAPAAFAQPSGHGPHGGPGGPGGRGFGIEHLLSSVKTQLSLNTSQQVMWDNAVAQTKAAREAGRGSMDKVRDALNAELAKAEPDFAAVGTVADNVQASQQTVRRQVRDEWLKLYATFSPTQKAVVRDAAKARVAKMETFRAKMKERMTKAQ